MPDWLFNYFGFALAFFVTLIMVAIASALIYVIFGMVRDWKQERKRGKKSNA